MLAAGLQMLIDLKNNKQKQREKEAAEGAQECNMICVSRQLIPLMLELAQGGFFSCGGRAACSNGCGS